jgi:hypothetical protein
MAYYGYNPADYRQDFNFIGDAVQDIGQGISYAKELKDANRRMETDMQLSVDAYNQTMNLADQFSTDRSMLDAYADVYGTGLTPDEFAAELARQGDIEGVSVNEQGGVTVDGQSGVDPYDIIGRKFKQDFTKQLPTGVTVDTDEGRVVFGSETVNGVSLPSAEELLGDSKLKGVMTIGDWSNRFAQNAAKFFEPLRDSNKIDNNTLFSMLSADVGTTEGMGLTGVEQDIKDNRNAAYDDDLYSKATTRDANEITMPSIDGTTEFTTNVSITPTEFNQMVRKGKYNQDTSAFKNTTAEVVSNYDNTYSQAVNEYIANSVASVGLDSMLRHIEKGTVAKKGAAIDVMAFNTAVTDEIANVINPTAISSLDGFQELSEGAQKKIIDNFNATVDMYTKSAVQLLTVTDPNELRGAGGGSKPGIQLIKQAIDIANQRYVSNADRIAELKDLDKLDASQAAELKRLQKQNVGLEEKIAVYQDPGIRLESLGDPSGVPEISADDPAVEMIRVATNKMGDLNTLSVLKGMSPDEVQEWFNVNVSPDYKVTALGPGKGYSFTDVDGAPVVQDGEPFVLGATPDVGDVRAGEKGLTPGERKEVATGKRVGAEQQKAVRDKVIGAAATVINSDFNPAQFADLNEVDLVEMVKKTYPQLADRDDQFILDAYNEARLVRDPSLRETTTDLIRKASGMDF